HDGPSARALHRRYYRLHAEQAAVLVNLDVPLPTPSAVAPAPRARAAVLAASKNGRGLGRPDVLPRLEIWGCCREDDRRANLTECFQIGAVWNMVTEVVAHLSDL